MMGEGAADKEYLERIVQSLGDKPTFQKLLQIDANMLNLAIQAGFMQPDARDITSLNASTQRVFDLYHAIDSDVAIELTRNDLTFNQAIRTWLRLKYDRACEKLAKIST